MSKRSNPSRRPWAVIRRQVRLIMLLIRDPRVPLWMRAIPFLGFIYLLLPIELLPDVALLPFGILDDLVVIVLCLTIFVSIAPKEIVQDLASWLDAADISIDDLHDVRRLPPGNKKEE